MSESVDSHITSQYKIIKKIGSGAYGHVWQVQDRTTKQIKALKKNFDAFSNSTDAQRIYRQITFLSQLSHPNIVKLQKIIKAKNNTDIYLVFQHMDIDLFSVIRQGNILQQKHKKYIIYQICKALFYLHNSDIIHRDLKPSNVLINQQCEAKICDFGLVRLLQQPTQNQIVLLTDYIATRWYRAPQLLLGCNQYSKQVDIWSLGCLIGQIAKGKPLFQGTSTINQLQKILAWTGTPSQSDIKNLKVNLNRALLQLLLTKRKKHQQILSCGDKHFFDLISNILQFDPSKRLNIMQVMKHPYLEQFYNQQEINEIKNSPVNLKLDISDNTKLTLKQYRNFIYKKIEKHTQVLDYYVEAKKSCNKLPAKQVENNRLQTQPDRTKCQKNFESQGHNKNNKMYAKRTTTSVDERQNIDTKINDKPIRKISRNSSVINNTKHLKKSSQQNNNERLSCQVVFKQIANNISKKPTESVKKYSVPVYTKNICLQSKIGKKIQKSALSKDIYSKSKNNFSVVGSFQRSCSIQRLNRLSTKQSTNNTKRNYTFINRTKKTSFNSNNTNNTNTNHLHSVKPCKVTF